MHLEREGSGEMTYRLHHDHGRFPCLHCHPHSYIRLVQHLIERCLLLRMSRDDTVEALAKHASIRPLVTLTVWKELLKENRGFFRAYYQMIPMRPQAVLRSSHHHHVSPSFRRRQWR